MRRAVSWLMALFFFTLPFAGCGSERGSEGDDKPDEGAPAPGVDPNLRIGHVMIEIGDRLETAGRAAEAEAWGLAAYEAEELLEMFEMDMTRAALPGDCNDPVSDQMYANLLEQLPALRSAAEARDGERFGEAFATTSGHCNGCHAGCNVPFVRVPRAPGAEIPRVAPISTGAHAADPPAVAPEGAND